MDHKHYETLTTRGIVMAVFRRKRNGKYSEKFDYDFKINGQRFKGCTHKTVKREALAFEAKLKDDLRALKEEQSDQTKKETLIRFREKITAEIQGNSIPLEELWDRFYVEGPSQMKRIPNEKGWKGKRSVWEDFHYFLNERHPKCQNLNEITIEMAQEYIGCIKKTGKFNKTISSTSHGTYTNPVTKMSSSSINNYITQLRQIFRVMAKSAKLLNNPFDHVEKVKISKKPRDVFEIYELEKIDKYLRDKKSNKELNNGEQLNFIINEALYVIGINTGLRRADISLLKWSDVDFKVKSIKRELRKTKESVCVPLTLQLYTFLKEKEVLRVNDYVTPELAEMYIENDDGVGRRFKVMLKDLDIDCLKAYDDRSRKISNKDIHSLRHTFCYLHGMQGTELVTVQSMVGHMDKKMTEAYMMHKTEELKREAIEKFALKTFQAISFDPLKDKKKALIEQIQQCNSESLLDGVGSLFQEKEFKLGKGAKIR